ncbi:LysR family transcriptional regulator [Dactylosporangium sp. NPDC000555]|uniref:LysR family transcriptional regulator n=1 Tax=Dactylosporangium sp. NPDC000555 TaxID=3154260 RepID=UPI003328507C
MSGLPDLESLRLLVRVAELGSLGQAARALGMTQPSATKRLASLERRAGLPLLVRTPRGSGLTNDGRVVVDWSMRLLEAADEFQASLTALREARAAQLRVAASMTVAEALLPGWLHKLGLREPDVRVGLTVVNSAEVARLLLAGETIDVGFVEGPSVPAGLGQRPVGHDELIVVVAPRHPWARRRRPLQASELAATRLVVREVGSGTRDTLELALRRLDPVPAHLALGSNAAVKGAAMAGSAPAVLSRYAVEAELAAGQLVAVPVVDLSLMRTLRAVWPRGRRLTGAATALLRVIEVSGGPERVRRAGRSARTGRSG